MEEDIVELEMPHVGATVSFEGQLFIIQGLATQQELTRDAVGHERHTLDIRLRADWQEEGYQL